MKLIREVEEFIEGERFVQMEVMREVKYYEPWKRRRTIEQWEKDIKNLKKKATYYIVFCPDLKPNL